MSQETQKVENVIIIGSGPAGLTSAIYASRANLDPLCIEGEEAGGQLMTTTDVENYPGFPKGVQGPELMQITREQAARFGTRFITRNVSRVDLTQKPFKVWIGEDLHLTKSIIVSTGASAKYLGLENERELIGRGVSACATCDGAFFRDVEVAIVGGGDTAMEEALFLTRFASKVHILHRRDSFRASKIMADRAISHPKVEVHWNTVVDAVNGENQLESLRLKNTVTNETQERKFDGLFVAIGHKPNTDVFKGLLEMDDVGYLVTEPKSTRTSVEGVFAAGDVADSVYRQAITAAGTGCMAAIDCERWLESQGH